MSGEAGGWDRRMEIDGLDDDLQEAGVGTTIAVVIATVAALLLVALPAAVALQGPARAGESAALGLGGFAAAALGLKLVAIAWGVAEELTGAYPARAVTENAD